MRPLMSETCRVMAVDGNQVTLQKDCLSNESCFGCMNAECKTRSKFLAAKNPLGLSLETGQLVEVKARSFPAFVQALAALGVPALGFAAGFFLVGILFPAAGESAKSAAGVFLMFAAAFTYYKIRGRFPAENPLWITRKIF